MPAFADTSFFVALISPTDASHASAARYEATLADAVTSEWVLCELGNFLSGASNRSLFVRLVERLRSLPTLEVVPAQHSDFDKGLALYAAREDKEWSLVDCISFVIMERLKLSDALTADHHFHQAGFNALLIP